MNRNIWDEIRLFFKSGSVVSKLMLINIAVFLVINIFKVFLFLFAVPQSAFPINEWIGVSSNTGILLQRPWGIFTYMFVQEEFFHIFFNMFMFYVGGRLFISYLGEKRLTTTYIIGGLAGALFFILAFNTFPGFAESKQSAYMIGASASVLAIFIAIAAYMPNLKLNLLFIGQVRLKYIALIMIVIDIISIPRGNAGGYIAHLGGAFWGFMYIMMLKNGNDISSFFQEIFKPIKKIFSKKSKLKVEYKNQRPMNDDDYSAIKKQNQLEIDKILDKISQSGYQSLTAREKELLFKMGNNK